MDQPTKNYVPYLTRVNRFHISGEEVGIGSTGFVKLAKEEITNKKFAVKIVSKRDSKAKEDSLKEIYILNKLRHSNIIRIEHVEDLKDNIYIFMEYCEHGDLYSQMLRQGPFNEARAQAMFHQMVAALEFAHLHGICHHDFKLENCVVDSDGKLRVIDFAFATEFNNHELFRNYCGSPAYAAPEVLFRKPHDYTVDIFSLGTCLYYMLTGSFPFVKDETRTTFDQLCRNVKACRIEFPEGMSPEAKDLITRMLSKQNRPNWNVIKEHPWYKKTAVPQGSI